jgi:hypothetical protein
MRFQRLGLTLAAALTLALVPTAARAQSIVRDPCFGRWDYCTRRDDIERLQRDRAFDRQVQAEARQRHLEDARLEREINGRIRADARDDARAEARFAAVRQSELRAELQDRARERAMERRQEAARIRTLRIRTIHFR